MGKENDYKPQEGETNAIFKHLPKKDTIVELPKPISDTRADFELDSQALVKGKVIDISQ